MRKLEKTEVGATWASRASGSLRWLLPVPLEPRDGCSRSPGTLECQDSCSESLWSFEMAAPRAFGASKELLPEPLEPRTGCSRSLWSLEMAAAWRKLSRRWSKKLRSSPKTLCSKTLCDECGDEPASQGVLIHVLALRQSLYSALKWFARVPVSSERPMYSTCLCT